MHRILSVALTLSAIALALVAPLGADEGMWQPSQLPELASELEALGLEIDPDRLSKLTEHPMNAVISLGFCTASFVSPKGLAVTNHHCAHGFIQYNSSEENNYIADGFLAAEMSEELFAGPGSRILVTVEVDDVTDRVLAEIPADADGRERYQAIEKAQKSLVAACEAEPGYRCRVYPFHMGLEYRLIKQLEIRDVRLAYAPPKSIGSYGGDIDNWIWPRHTGDYSFLRAYVGPDGKPADYSEENVPYEPESWLTVSTAGVSEDDLVLVAGYPGRTYRHRLAQEVDNQFHWFYPTREKLYREWLDILAEATEGNEEAAILYAGWVERLNNSAKNYGGMIEGFARSDVLERKAALERNLQAWIEGDDERRARYQSAIDDLKALVDEQQATRERATYYEMLAQRSSMLGAARTIYRLSREKQKPDMEREPGYQERDMTQVRERLQRVDRSFDPAVDRAVWSHFIERYAAIPVEQHVTAFDEWFGIDGNSVDAEALGRRLDEMYDGTGLGDEERRLAWMDATAEEIEASEDPFLKLAVHLYPSDMELEESDKERTGRFTEARSRYMAALIAYLESLDRAVYPDANSTLRVTYGTVTGYTPRDALTYTPFTRLEGIVEKHTGEEPFDSPEDQLAAIAEERFGRFAKQELGSVPVNFLSTVDSTGGNSGSPTLNARAELVGLLFDGNYESIIADWDFIPSITRSIHVDIRYVLWLMEEVHGADNLLHEMGVAGD
jgi:hypothetical protein